MSSGETASCIARLMSTFSFEIRDLPDKLKCAQCKSVLKDACQVPCGCRFCRACIDGLMARGSQFCPGGSQECDKTPLSTALQDYRANRSILKLTAKCPESGCSHECPLADMEGHWRACQTNNIDCPFRELGCLQGRLTKEEMSDHLQHQNRRHSEILIEMVANIKKDVLTLKRKLVLAHFKAANAESTNKLIQNELKLIKNENKSIKSLIQSTFNLMKNEMKSIKNQIKLNKRQVDEMCQSGEQHTAQISAVTEAVASNRDALGTEMEAGNEDIRLVNGDMQSIKNQFNSMKFQVQPTPVDSSCDEWVIDTDVAKTKWGWTLGTPKTSANFTGVTHPHKYRLESGNSDSRALLWIQLRILSDPNDCQLRWPFRAVVTVTVADRNKREACRKLTRQCQFEKPPHRSSSSDPFEFPHSELRTAGLDLGSGVRVSCQVVPVQGH